MIKITKYYYEKCLLKYTYLLTITKLYEYVINLNINYILSNKTNNCTIFCMFKVLSNYETNLFY